MNINEHMYSYYRLENGLYRKSIIGIFEYHNGFDWVESSGWSRALIDKLAIISYDEALIEMIK